MNKFSVFRVVCVIFLASLFLTHPPSPSRALARSEARLSIFPPFLSLLFFRRWVESVRARWGAEKKGEKKAKLVENEMKGKYRKGKIDRKEAENFMQVSRLMYRFTSFQTSAPRAKEQRGKEWVGQKLKLDSVTVCVLFCVSPYVDGRKRKKLFLLSGRRESFPRCCPPCANKEFK